MPRELEDWRPNPEREYAEGELQTLLAKVIEKLEPEYRIALVLRDIEELSTQQTADALGLSVTNLKSRLLRARLKFRKKLNRHFQQRASQ
jgi:RNA polymerase sigma-70 factor, ECF subfamily